MGRCVNSPHRSLDAQDDLERCPMCRWTGKKVSEEQVTPVVVILKRRLKMTWARETAQARQEGSQTVLERPPVGESQSNGIIERAVGLVAGQARTLKAVLEHRIGTRVPPDAMTLCLAGGTRCVPDEQVRHWQRQKRADAQGEKILHKLEEESGTHDSILECLLAC